MSLDEKHVSENLKNIQDEIRCKRKTSEKKVNNKRRNKNPSRRSIILSKLILSNLVLLLAWNEWSFSSS